MRAPAILKMLIKAEVAFSKKEQSSDNASFYPRKFKGMLIQITFPRMIRCRKITLCL
jgi:hypothetical protein